MPELDESNIGLTGAGPGQKVGAFESPPATLLNSVWMIPTNRKFIET